MASTDFPIVVIGLGGAGRSMCTYIQQQGATVCRFISIDKDDRLELTLHVSSFHGSDWITEERVLTSLSECADFLKGQTKAVEKVVFLSGLGGRTGTKLFTYFSGLADFKRAVFVCFLPFNFEGEGRKNKAKEAISSVSNDNVDLRLYPNQELLKNAYPEENIAAAFRRQGNEIRRDILSDQEQPSSDRMAGHTQRISLQFESPWQPLKTKKSTQPEKKFRQEVPSCTPTPQKRNPPPYTKIILLIIFLTILPFLAHKDISLGGTIMTWAKNILLETSTTATSFQNAFQTVFTKETPQEILARQAEWMGEVEKTFFQFSSSDRVRIQTWLANNFGYSGALDGLWGPRTETSFSMARSAHDDVDRLFMTAFRETPTIRQAARPPAQSGKRINAQQDLQNRVFQLRVACSISPSGSLGERMADQQLYNLTGERCSRPPAAFQPIVPIQPTQPNLPTTCTQRLPAGNFRIPGLTYPLAFDCQ